MSSTLKSSIQNYNLENEPLLEDTEVLERYARALAKHFYPKYASRDIWCPVFRIETTPHTSLIDFFRCLTYKKTNHCFSVVADHIQTVDPDSQLARIVTIFWPEFIDAVRDSRNAGPFTNSDQEQLALDKYIGKTLLFAFMRHRGEFECFDDPVAVKQTILSTTIEIVSQKNPGEWRQVRNIRRCFSAECRRAAHELQNAPSSIRAFALPIVEDKMQTWIDGIKTMTETIQDTWEMLPSAKAIISFVLLMAATDKAEQWGVYGTTDHSEDFLGGLARWLQPIRQTRKKLLVSGFFDILYPNWKFYSTDPSTQTNLQISATLRHLLLDPFVNDADDYSIPHLLMSTLVDGDWNEELKPSLEAVTAGALLNAQYTSLATPDPDDYDLPDELTDLFNFDDLYPEYLFTPSPPLAPTLDPTDIREIQNHLITGSLFGKALTYLHSELTHWTAATANTIATFLRDSLRACLRRLTNLHSLPLPSPLPRTLSALISSLSPHLAPSKVLLLRAELLQPHPRFLLAALHIAVPCEDANKPMCEVCGPETTFSSKNNLERHRRTAHGEKLPCVYWNRGCRRMIARRPDYWHKHQQTCQHRVPGGQGGVGKRRRVGVRN